MLERNGGRVAARYMDVISPQKNETRTGEEIKNHMKFVLGRLADET